ncbi:ABC transporter ATP-binding protein [Stagnihabitans tardus]|uniref:ATP-binding cassette domain-containing protein n=1 Tax=Stagnihabitans tardus TaxID=2699202 RepID=A0AAE4YEF7_9RHOB|nr:ABC transporter ATP-binding protein [Stagnihabitans tardus]NBZ88185.1 ATP-binding cassette domain-containing protein [Stagnihabitans tardus]
MPDLLTVKGLTKSFQSGGGLFQRPRTMMAVREVSFSLRKGEVLGVVGESGCGKSTLARLVLRLIEPTSGQVTFDGTDLRALSAPALRRMRQRMAMVFQDPYSSLDPRFTLAQVLAEPFTVQDQKAPDPGAMLETVGLPATMAQSHPHQLSGGQRQRVGIARALALSPDLVVLDEPTASLDVSIQAQIIALLSQLRDERGLTYLFISHDLGLVRYFCDRVLVMYLGAVVEVLPRADAAPRHPYTAALQASAFVPDPGQRRALAPLTGEIPSPFDLPPGCAFAGRCPRASDLCRMKRPELEPGPHPVACFHPLKD